MLTKNIQLTSLRGTYKEKWTSSPLTLKTDNYFFIQIRLLCMYMSVILFCIDTFRSYTPRIYICTIEISKYVEKKLRRLISILVLVISFEKFLPGRLTYISDISQVPLSRDILVIFFHRFLIFDKIGKYIFLRINT